MSPGLEALSHRVLAALCNGLFQGAVLALLVALALRALRQANAATRYGVELTALTTIALLPVLHLLFPGKVPLTSVHQADRSPAARSFGWEMTGESAGRSAGTEAGPGRDVVTTHEPHQERGLQSAGTHTAARPFLRAEARAPQRLMVPAHAGPPGVSTTPEPPLAVGRDSVDPLGPSTTPGSTEESRSTGFKRAAHDLRAKGTSPAPQPGRAGTPLPAASGALASARPAAEPGIELDSPSRLSGWELNVPAWITFPLLGAWVLVAATRLARLAWQYGALWCLRRYSTAPPAVWCDLLSSLAGECGLRRRVSLRLCDELASPLATGFHPAAILLPTRLAGVSPADLENILRHELAHVQRRDDWSNLLQRLIEALFAFHPAVWWLSHRLTLDREIACDDHVLAAVRSPRDYALFLTDFAARMPGRFLPAAPAAWSRNSQLKQRIRMLLDPHRNRSTAPARYRTGVLSAAWLALAVAGVQLGPRLAFGGESAASANAALPAPTPGEATSAAPADVLADPLRSPDPKPKAVIAPAPSAETDAAPAPTGAVIAIHPTPHLQPTAVVIADLAAAPVVSGAVALPATLAVVQPPPPPVAPRYPMAAPRAESPGDEWAKPANTPRPRGDSVEARLERLERQLQRLLEQRDAAAAPPRGRPDGKDPFFVEQERAAQAKEDFKARALELKAQAEKMKVKSKDARPPEMFAYGNVPDADQIKQQVSKILEQVAGQVERATREAERAVLEAQRSAQLAQQQLRGAREGKEFSLEQHRRALEREREALQNRIEAIEGQLERLEEQLDRVDEQFERLDEDIDRMEAEQNDEHADHKHDGGKGKEDAAPEPKPARDENVRNR